MEVIDCVGESLARGACFMDTRTSALLAYSSRSSSLSIETGLPAAYRLLI